jgi:hypothetical protein
MPDDTAPVPTFNVEEVFPDLHGYRLMNGDGAVVAVLPPPNELAGFLRQHIELDIAQLRAAVEARGGVLAVADTFTQQRHLQQAEELLGEYERKLKDLRKVVRQLQEEVLADAVGADGKGVPLGNLTVPDAEGDVKITRRFANSYAIDTAPLFQAFASMFADQHADAVARSLGVEVGSDPQHRALVGVAIAEAIVEALGSIGELGKFEAQVSKVRAYADALARGGHDAAASVVSQAIAKTREYQGVNVERKTT